MFSKVKAVIDTNIWVSALLLGSNALAIVDALDANQFTLVLSNELLDELVRVIARPKLSAIIPNKRQERILTLIKEKAVFIKLADIRSVSRDPKDDMFLACALASNADYLVTGDEDLLCLKQHGVTEIISPASFLQILINTEGVS